MDGNINEIAEVIPEASSFIESFRSVGYNFETALADIIDNSISAYAKNIWINFEWKGADTWFSVKDDGIGMSNEELIEAMKLGCKNPHSYRQGNDLGRYGLGLKSSSFSQCRNLTVISKKDSGISYWTWDLDYIINENRWEIIKTEPDSYFLDEINNLYSGTIVIWKKSDRIVKGFSEDNEKDLEKFLNILENTENHLSMTFHKFIESGRIKIYFKEREIKAWNPFLSSLNSTQAFPEEYLGNNSVTIKGYVLPHKSKINDEIYNNAGGIKGWNQQQGFYIYRNDRLLVTGGWMKIFRMEEHYKLARIEINLPNNLDEEWQIDLKKSVARPPLEIRDRIKAYATKVRSYAVEVYRHRGKIVRNTGEINFTPIWIYQKKGDKYYYKINREHPLIEKIKESACINPQKAISEILNIIESTIPTKSIYIEEAENSEHQMSPPEIINNEDSMKNLIIEMYKNLINEGRTKESAISIISNIEPFNYYSEFLKTLSIKNHE